jgi:hypothetical protein
MQRVTTVRYAIKPDRVDENESLCRAVVRRTARENARWGLLRLLQRGGRHDVRAPVRQPARGRRRGGHRAAELCILSGKASRPLPDAARSDPAQPAIAGQLRSGVGLTRIHRLPHRVGDLVREVGGDHGARQHDAARQQRQQAPSGLASRPVGESFGDQLGLSISCAPCPLGSSTHIEPGGSSRSLQPCPTDVISAFSALPP